MNSLLLSTLNTRCLVCGNKNTIIYRSDMLDNCVKEDFDILSKLNIKVAIDLRNPNRKSKVVSAFFDEYNIKYYNYYFGSFDEEKRFFSNSISDDFLKNKTCYYLSLFESCKETIKSIINDILNSTGGVLIFCKLGRDRTGLVCFLLGLLCGASKDELINEYASSDYYLENMLIYGDERLDFDYLNKMICNVYRAFFEKYSSVNDYVRELGFKLDDIEKLKYRVMGGN